MGWESGRAAYREVPGTTDPVVFKCASLGLAAGIFTAAAFTSVAAWQVIDRRTAPMPWFFFSPILLAAGGLFSLGCIHLFVYRRIEVYPRERKVMSLKRTPLGGTTREVYDFDRLHSISMSLVEPTDDGGGGGVVVILTAGGEAIDFGNQSYDGAGRLAARLHALTGLPVGK